MTPALVHSFILIAAIVVSFVVEKTGLAQYDLQICATLFIALFVSQKIFKQRSRLLESVVFTLVVMIIVNSTGGTASPVFFLIYFLLFSLALLLEPLIAIVVTLTLVIFYLFSLPQNLDLKSLIPIFSLAFLTPFALFLGQEFIESQKLQTDTFLFLSLMLKNHLRAIKKSLDNFLGDRDLHQMKEQTREMERLIDKFEENQSCKR
jgi:hypothetical protein